ncbi:MAG: hypothetical protein WBO57_09750 [Gammaproteobacteria bacterium]
MNITRLASIMISIVLLAGGTGKVLAADAGISPGQQELNEALEVMKKSGMDPAQIKQIESMMHGMVNEGVNREAARVEQEHNEFDAATAGNGLARVEVEGNHYELRVTKCEVKDLNTGFFNISAGQGWKSSNGGLHVIGGGALLQSTVLFAVGERTYESEHTKFSFDGQTLAWDGVVDGGEAGAKVPLKLYLTCAAT